MPAPRGSNLPARIEGVSAAALVLAASAFVARTGFRLLVRRILPRLAKELVNKSASSQAISQDPVEQPDYVIRGWRAWSVHHGTEHASGAEHLEWRIKSPDKTGKGRVR